MNEPASGPQRAVRTMGLNIRGEKEKERERERESTPRCVCNKRRDTRVPSLSPSFLPSSPLPSPPSPPFSSAAERAKRAQGVDGGAMHAIYQHRTDNEVPRRLPVVEDAG